ncbi:MAG: tetratricopeptide repeat protein [Candidatus Odinarchaeota archaeon]
MFYLKTKEFFNIELLKNKCRYKKALHEISKLEENKDLSIYEQIFCYTLKSSLLFELGNYNKALEFIDKVSPQSQKLKPNIHLIDALITKSQILWRKGNLKEILELIANIEELLKKISDENPTEIMKRWGLLSDIKGWIYIYEGDINNARKNMENSLKLREEVGDGREIALSYYLKGNIYFYYKIDWDYSQKCIQKTLELAEKIDFKFLMGLCFGRLGDFCFFGGNLDRAFEYYTQSYNVLKDISHKRGTAWALEGLAYFYEEKGDLNRALELLDKSNNIYEEMGDSFGLTENLDYCILFSLNNNDLERAKYYINRMEQIMETFDVKMTKILFQVNKALFLKTSPLASNQTKAKEILIELVEQKTISETSLFFEAIYRALLNLCDLLLNELRNTHNLELLNDIQSYIHQMLYISKNANSFWWLAETYLLQSKLELITLDLKEAEDSITQAKEIAEKHDLVQLTERILVEQSELHEQLNKWEVLKNSKTHITELIDLAQIDNQLMRMLKKRYFFD